MRFSSCLIWSFAFLAASFLVGEASKREKEKVAFLVCDGRLSYKCMVFQKSRLHQSKQLQRRCFCLGQAARLVPAELRGHVHVVPGIGRPSPSQLPPDLLPCTVPIDPPISPAAFALAFILLIVILLIVCAQRKFVRVCVRHGFPSGPLQPQTSILLLWFGFWGWWVGLQTKAKVTHGVSAVPVTQARGKLTSGTRNNDPFNKNPPVSSSEAMDAVCPKTSVRAQPKAAASHGTRSKMRLVVKMKMREQRKEWQDKTRLGTFCTTIPLKAPCYACRSTIKRGFRQDLYSTHTSNTMLCRATPPQPPQLSLNHRRFSW
jgi:hypothetical protein